MNRLQNCACVVFALWAGNLYAAAAQQELLCRPTESERVQIDLTRARILAMPNLISESPGKKLPMGCGLWSVSIRADGRLETLALVRFNGPSGSAMPYRDFARIWVSELRFKSADKAWKGMVALQLAK